MKIQIRFTLIIMAMMFVVCLTQSIILVQHAASLQMESALLSQERLDAEQARITEGRYESYLSIVTTLADAMADYDAVEAGRQRTTFD